MMPRLPGIRRNLSGRSRCGGAVSVFAVLAIVAGSVVASRSSVAQQGGLVTFPKRPVPAAKPGPRIGQPQQGPTEQMLVRANEVNYDYVNDRVSAVGNVQIYYSGTTLEADRVIYDQKTKRVHAAGNVRLTEATGRITYGEILNLSDDFRDGFVDSLRIDAPDQTRIAAARGDRSAGNFTVLQSAVYTACEACAEDPRRPPKWQVKAARIIHDQGEQMIYFENAYLEFFGVPLAYIPYFATPDPTAKRKTGFLIPTYRTSSLYGVAFITPYYWALAPNYDFTLTPMTTTRQGPLVQGEWRHRLLNGAYTIRASGIFQLDPKAFSGLPGETELRGDVHSAGQFRINDRWVWGWDGTAISDKTYYQDYGFFKIANSHDLLKSTPDYVLSQGYLQGRGTSSFFDMRAMYFYGFTSVDNQRQSPIVHPVINHEYTFAQPILGGEVSVRSNLTSLSREAAAFDAITAEAFANGFCALSADPAQKTPANCVFRGVPGFYTRASSEAQWRRTIIDSFGQMFTPFMSVRGDAASVNVSADPGVANFMNTGQYEVFRAMPTAGIDYRYPFINVQSWGTQTIEPIAQFVARPDETHIGQLPNEDSQSFLFDASNLFRPNKFAGWDRVEGGGRLNAGVQYTAQFNQGGYFNVLIGQSYHLFGQNSFAVASPANTGLDSGLDKARSDYVARVTYQPNSQLTLTSRFRFDEADYTMQRAEYEAAVNFERWQAAVIYGRYAPQPALGFLNNREGITGTAKFKLAPNWLTFGGARFDLEANQLNTTQIGLGYIDDCLILAANYITEYRYNTVDKYAHTVMLQVSLRTIGGTTTSQGLATLGSVVGSSSAPGIR